MPKVNPPRSIETDLHPISLLSTLAKVFESIVGRWSLDPNQFGALRVDPEVMPWSEVCASDALLSMLGDPSEPSSLILPRHSIGWIIIY